MKTIAIIPARSGSKGLIHKNIAVLAGKPLIAHTIVAAIASNQFDEIMVSTDSLEYAEIAKAYGANVPFLRSKEQSSDTANSWDVVKEVLAGYQQQGIAFDCVMLLQPTSPLRNSNDIVGAMNEMQQKNANAIVSVCEVDHSPFWSNTLPSNHSMKDFILVDSVPRQALDVYYRINGAMYLVKVPYLMQANSIYQNQCYAWVMDKVHSIDIDDELDFITAEAILHYFSNKEKQNP